MTFSAKTHNKIIVFVIISAFSPSAMWSTIVSRLLLVLSVTVSVSQCQSQSDRYHCSAQPLWLAEGHDVIGHLQVQYDWYAESLIDSLTDCSTCLTSANIMIINFILPRFQSHVVVVSFMQLHCLHCRMQMNAWVRCLHAHAKYRNLTSTWLKR